MTRPPLPDPARSPGERDRPHRGSRIARIGAALGTPLMPWQAYAARVGSERLPDGRPAYGIVVVSTPRQAGKSALARAVCVEGMLARPDARVWSTAQTRNAARDRWLDGARALRRSPSLGAATDLRMANGSEHAALPNGSTWRPFAPLPDALHGETTTRVLVDEAWAFDRARGTELLQAIVPTGITVPEFQLWIVSAAGTDESEWLADLVEAGTTGAATGHGVAAIVWQTSAREGDPGMIEQVIADHPAAGYTITADGLRDAAAIAATPREYLRAYGNVWTATTATLFLADAVEAVTAPADVRPAGAGVALSADVSPDRGSGAIAAAWTDPDLGDVAATVAHGPGVRWMLEACRGLATRYAAPITLDPIGPTAGLADDLRRAGVPVVTMTTREVTTAAADLLDAVTDRTVALVSDPALLAALSIASRRSVGRDAWAFDRRGGAGDLSPLIATAHALHAHRRPASIPYLA